MPLPENPTMTSGKPDVTLQINLCAGDLPYCEQTVPALVAAHGRDVREVLAVVDCCYPQCTPIFQPAARFPIHDFQASVRKLRSLCLEWKARGIFTRVEFFEPDRPLLRALNQKYCGRPTAWSHDHLGHAFSAYFAGWDYCRTRWVAHFDADILVHQAPGFSWIRSGLDALERIQELVAVSPRIAPPLAAADEAMIRIQTPRSGWLPSWRLEPAPLGWRSDWLSTRCHLIDRERLAPLLPFTPARGPAIDRISHLLNLALSPLYSSTLWTSVSRAGRGHSLSQRISRGFAHKVIPPFPLPPEVLFYEGMRQRGLPTLYLRDPGAWILHPDVKREAFLSLLPLLLAATSRGECPPAQRGLGEIQFEAWDAQFQTLRSS